MKLNQLLILEKSVRNIEYTSVEDDDGEIDYEITKYAEALLAIRFR